MSRPRTVSTETILKTAKELFLEKGPQVSTNEIAQAVGLSQAALFKRFKTKHDLFMAAIASPGATKKLEDLIDWLENNPQPGPFRTQLEDLLTRTWGFMVDMIPRILALHSNRFNTCPSEMFKNYEEIPPVKLLEAITIFVSKAIDNKQISTVLSPRSVAMNIMGTLQGRAFFFIMLDKPRNKDDDHEYIAQTANILCNGIEAQEPMR